MARTQGVAAGGRDNRTNFSTFYMRRLVNDPTSFQLVIRRDLGIGRNPTKGYRGIHAAEARWVQRDDRDPLKG